MLKAEGGKAHLNPALATRLRRLFGERFLGSEPERRHQLQTEAAVLAVDVGGCSLVTSARFAQRNGRGREGKRADRQTMHRSKSRVGHGGKEIEVANVCLSDHLAPYRKPFWDFTVGFQWWQRDTLETLFAVDQHTFMVAQAAEQMRLNFVQIGREPC